MSASPSGPVQLHGGCGQLPGQPGEQPADFVAGQRDEQVIVRVAAAGLGRGQDGQEREDEQRQDGPPVPGCPAPDLVLVQGQRAPCRQRTRPRPLFHRDPATRTSWANGTGRGAWAR